MPTFTATCSVGRVGANALVGSELNSNNRGFLMHVTESYLKLFEVDHRISVSLMEITQGFSVYKLKSRDN